MMNDAQDQQIAGHEAVEYAMLTLLEAAGIAAEFGARGTGLGELLQPLKRSCKAVRMLCRNFAAGFRDTAGIDLEQVIEGSIGKSCFKHVMTCGG